LLYLDARRKAANIMLDHHAAGMPPVLRYDYEILLDAREFERPANYALVRIVPPPDVVIDDDKPPVVVVDPRAGHGPGIGGFKQDSEVGMALKEGFPTYFVMFYPEPCEGQTLECVELAEIRFLEHVHSLHPKVGRPVVYGNCQAGWAVAMLGADRPDVCGPIVLSGAPLSYWAGKPGSHPMRAQGGIMGGKWAASGRRD
jgi:pimeloyl-ACP methyl ester carboxylesterase